MLRRSFILLTLFLSISGCARFHMHPKATDVPGFVPQNQITYTAPFNRIKIIGPFQVNLHTQSKRSSFTLHGNQKDLDHVKWYVANHQLIIQAKREQDKPQIGLMYLDINVPRLASFSYHGSGSIVAQSLDVSSLDLFIQNDGPTRLEGSFTLHRAALGGRGKIRMKGVRGTNVNLLISGHAKVQIIGTIQLSELKMKNSAWLSAYWLNSHVLKMRLRDQACVQLAGTVDFLDATLRDTARFNGRYLRAQRAFVKTSEQSEADINVVEAQHTLATGSSNIYFYDLPDMRADFMVENGSVLDLREWERPFFREATYLNR